MQKVEYAIQFSGLDVNTSSGSGTESTPVQKTENTAVGIRCADHATPSVSKSWH
jgi:hypothetical protein